MPFFVIVAMKHIPLEVSIAGMADGSLFDNYIGNQKGIQGHQNSSYLDATLFGLFALSSCFDELFLQADINDKQSIEYIIQKKIVNPLRRYNFHSLCVHCIWTGCNVIQVISEALKVLPFPFPLHAQSQGSMVNID